MSFKSLISRIYQNHLIAKDSRQFRIIHKNFSENVQAKASNSGSQRLKMVAICPPTGQLPSMIKTEFADIGNKESLTNKFFGTSTTMKNLIFLIKMGIFGSAVWWTSNEGIWGDAKQAEVFWNRWIFNIYMKLSTEQFFKMPPGSPILQPNSSIEIMKEDLKCCYNQVVKKITQ